MIPLGEIAIRLSVATVLAAVIGFERERHEASAGLRTHAMVGLGAALFMIVSAYGFTDILTNPSVHLDPSRVASQVVTGIGFLGAGAIIMRSDTGRRRGLTTAASVWSVAAVGLAVGGGLYFAALAATALSLVVLIAFKPIDRYLDKRWHTPVLPVPPPDGVER